MVYTKNLILVCTGRDTARAARLGLPVLHLCLGVTPAGALQRLQLPTAGAHCLLGLCDPPHDLTACRADRLAADLVFEAQRAGAPGVFADFEHDTPAGRRLLSAFDDALHEADIRKFAEAADKVIQENLRESETNLKRIRRANGLSQKQLAEVSGVALRMIRLYEQRQNDINKARAYTLRALAKSLNCQLEDLMEPQITTED